MAFLPTTLVHRALSSPLVHRLAAPHGIDRYLEHANPRWAVHEVRAVVVAVDRQTADTVTLTLRANRAWTGFRAGQHVVVGAEIDGIVHARCFSLAGSPHRADRLLELTVKAHPAGRVSTYLVESAVEGTVLRLSPAQGDFVVPARIGRNDHLVLISGGSGITPVLSMLRSLVDEHHRGPVTFVHYASNADALCYRRELDQLVARLPQGRLLLGLTQDPGVGDLDGHFGPPHLRTITAEPEMVEVFVCGPASLLAAVEAGFGDAGPGGRVHVERFGPPPRDPSIDAGDAAISFCRSGVVSPSVGTVLESAEAAGLAPAFGCRRGICGTCVTTRSAGQVRDVISGRVSTADPAPIRPCISVASGDVAVDL